MFSANQTTLSTLLSVIHDVVIFSDQKNLISMMKDMDAERKCILIT